MKESYNRDPLVASAESLLVTEDVAKIKKKVAQLEVGDKTNYGTVVAIGSDSITFKAKDTPKTKIVFRQRKMGSPDYLLMNLVKLTPDGKKLEIFFDENSIGIGEAFTLKYMRGIVDSKCFVPIMSDEYYSKNHCKNEMDLAFKRYVEELIDIHPIAFSFECIPDIYTHINTEITENNSNFLDKLYAKLSK